MIMLQNMHISYVQTKYMHEIYGLDISSSRILVSIEF